MNNLEKLGKLSETIGKIYFRLLLMLLIIAAIAVQVSRIENNQGIGKIAVIIGTLVGFGVFYLILRSLFRPIYGLNAIINQKDHNSATNTEFKRKWWVSLICSIIMALLPVIPTFGISILIMIPQFMLLAKSKDL